MTIYVTRLDVVQPLFKNKYHSFMCLIYLSTTIFCQIYLRKTTDVLYKKQEIEHAPWLISSLLFGGVRFVLVCCVFCGFSSFSVASAQCVSGLFILDLRNSHKPKDNYKCNKLSIFSHSGKITGY